MRAANEILESARFSLSVHDADSLYSFQKTIAAILETLHGGDVLPEIRDMYDYSYACVGLARLQYMDQREVVPFFERALPWLFRGFGSEVVERMRLFLLTLDSLDDRDDVKNAVKEILLRSEASVTQSVLSVPNGFIKEWLAYVTKTTLGDFADSLKFADFMNTDINIVRLGAEEKEQLAWLFRFYSYMVTSSVTAEGMEDEFIADDDEAKTITVYNQDGVHVISQQEDSTFTKKTPQMVRGLRNIRFSQAQELTPLEADADTFAKESGMTEVSAKAVLVGLPTDTKTTVAALRVYAQGKSMEELVAPWYPNVTTAPVVCEAFQKLLVGDLKLASVHAAAIVWRLIEQLKESDQHKYRDLVYYDMESGYFHWNEAYVSNMEPESPIA